MHVSIAATALARCPKTFIAQSVSAIGHLPSNAVSFTPHISRARNPISRRRQNSVHYLSASTVVHRTVGPTCVRACVCVVPKCRVRRDENVYGDRVYEHRLRVLARTPARIRREIPVQYLQWRSSIRELLPCKCQCECQFI